MWGVQAGLWQIVSRLPITLRGFRRRRWQQLIKRLAPAEAQTHGEVNWHHSSVGVITKGMENSEEEAVMGLKKLYCIFQILLFKTCSNAWDVNVNGIIPGTIKKRAQQLTLCNSFPDSRSHAVSLLSLLEDCRWFRVVCRQTTERQ